MDSPEARFEKLSLPNRRRLMDFIEETARLRDGEHTLYSVQELTDTALLKTTIVDLDKAVDPNGQHIGLLPSLYSLSIEKKDGQPLASLTITDGFDSYVEIEEAGHERIEFDSVSAPGVDDMVGDFLARWHVNQHIARHEQK